jgi:hypothetical protein
MVAYACAVENGDAHSKNFSVLYAEAEGEISLPPAYGLGIPNGQGNTAPLASGRPNQFRKTSQAPYP